MIVTEQQAPLVEILCEKVGLVPTPHIRAIGRFEPRLNIIMGVVGYDGWTGTACEIHMVGLHPNWINREFIKAAFEYPFKQAGCKVLIGKVPSGNVEALKLDKHLGFTEVCVIPDAHPDGSLHIFTMRQEDCRWLERLNGKERATTSRVPSDTWSTALA